MTGRVAAVKLCIIWFVVGLAVAKLVRVNLREEVRQLWSLAAWKGRGPIASRVMAWAGRQP